MSLIKDIYYIHAVNIQNDDQMTIEQWKLDNLLKFNFKRNCADINNGQSIMD